MGPKKKKGDKKGKAGEWRGARDADGVRSLQFVRSTSSFQQTMILDLFRIHVVGGSTSQLLNPCRVNQI